MYSLDELAVTYHTDKSSKHHNYTPMYSHFMESRRNDPISLFEIGFGMGASARMWKDYFPNGKLYFMDDFSMRPEHKYDCIRLAEEMGVTLLEGKQQETPIPHGMDFVIDDGSHRPEDMIDSAEREFVHMAPHGLWFIEDTHCSWRPAYTNAPGYLYTEWLERLICLHEESETNYGNFYHAQRYIQDPLASQIYAFHLYKSVIVLERA